RRHRRADREADAGHQDAPDSGGHGGPGTALSLSAQPFRSRRRSLRGDPCCASVRCMTPLEPLLRELLGEALRRRRRAQGRTLADVAAQAGMSMQHLSDVERGRKDPSSEMVAAICGALDLTLGQLMSLAGATEA